MVLETIKSKIREKRLQFQFERGRRIKTNMEARTLARHEREKQTKQTAVFREAKRGEAQRKKISSGGGGFAGFQSAIGALAGTPQRAAPQRNNIDQLGSLLGGRNNGNGKKSSIYNIRI